ncbi:MAG: hypothetical protein MSQ05_10505 [Akkermansia sp.]|nr:hypothetical protein [Akkermansia sp.]
MKRSLVLFATLLGASLFAGCGGGDPVGKNPITFPNSPLLQENTSKVVFSGSVKCQDGIRRNVRLTVENIARGEADLSIAFGDDPQNGGTYPGYFIETQPRVFTIYTKNNQKFTVKYIPQGKTEEVDNKIAFPYNSPYTVLHYEGNPSQGVVQLTPPASNVCRLEWTETVPAQDNNPATTKDGAESVEFTTLYTE